jgi:hypothetical protein
MKKYLLLFALLTLLVPIACHKYDGLRDDVGGTLYIHGRLFYEDTLSFSKPFKQLPLANQTVMVEYASDTTNFIYSVKADSNGYFNFTNLRPGKYKIACLEKADTVMYYGSAPLNNFSTSVDNATILVTPSATLQNGVKFTVTDNAKQPLNSCTICLFRSAYLASVDTCQGASYILKTNSSGNAFEVNIPSGQYYANFKAIRVNSFVYSSASLFVDTVGIATKTQVIP